MTTIILAAGQGRRLWPLTARRPKCLIPIGGTPILGHALARIARAGLRDVLLVTGFQSDLIQHRVARLMPRNLRVRFVVNDRFAETNNLYSLWRALGSVDGPVAIVNGDDFFNWKILGALLESRAEASAVVDFTRPLPSDAMRVSVQGGQVTRLGKTLGDELASGNAIGLYSFSRRAFAQLGGEIDHRVASGRVNDFYVGAIDALASQVPIRAVPTLGLTWGEVDDHDDLAAAPAKLARIVAEERAVAVRARVPRWHSSVQPRPRRPRASYPPIDGSSPVQGESSAF